MEYAHKTSNCIVGREYLVAVATSKDRYSGKLYETPVFPLLHSDPTFSLGYKHYHIDSRFISVGKEGDWRIKSNGEVGYPIWVNHDGADPFVSIEFKPLKCIRKITYLKQPESTGKFEKAYWDWYESMIGKSCAGKKCPHYGATMILARGKLICPMHSLHADPITEKIVKPY